ncbi:MAG: cobalamin B12-binding domain-containing protein [Planctomycetota bacterium]|jgi:methylmalonyl-CoA mutase C-terminal domain/subunit
MTRPVRVLVAKPGLDGHDVGAKMICRALTDAGMDVTYTGLRQSPEDIAKAAKAHAVDAVGLSILSGAHLSLTAAVQAQLEAAGVSDVLLIVGGNIPAEDHDALHELGAAGVFSVGTPFEEIVEFLGNKVRKLER